MTNPADILTIAQTVELPRGVRLLVRSNTLTVDHGHDWRCLPAARRAIVKALEAAGCARKMTGPKRVQSVWSSVGSAHLGYRLPIRFAQAEAETREEMLGLGGIFDKARRAA